MEYGHAPGVQIYGSRDNRIECNAILRMPYAGVSIVGVRPDELSKDAGLSFSDSYGCREGQYQVRWHELPKKVTREEAKTWLHSSGNVVACNVVGDYMLWLDDGGCLYAWSSGVHNRWERNLLLRPPNRRAGGILIALYMDDFIDGHALTDNVSWGCGATISKGGNEWARNELCGNEKPKGLDALLSDIRQRVKAGGGWPKGADEDVLRLLDAMK
jgi:hypothetical protein